MNAEAVSEFDTALCGQGLDARHLPSPAGSFPMWLVDAGRSNAEAIEHLLSGEEMAAANRFRLRALRRRYIVAHGALRILFRDRYGVPSGEQDIGRNRFGKPHLIRFPGLQYSLSYSGDFVMIGVGEGDPIGVDIEVHRVIDDAAALMDIYFTAAERSAVLRRASPGTCSREFLEIWVRKEACVKACGCGLGIPLKDVECGVSGDQMTTVQFGGSRYRTGALRLGDPIMAWSRRTSL
ncbi:MAG: 4'-phosphopantetheinyl transferase superfamily protein [Sphingopyxis sp.]|nr:4'-phosphopantetheinyl transferase superfamily protein [Sphingopyxis sp.]